MQELLTHTMKLTDVRQNFSELVNKIFRKEKRILVEKNGIPVAAIISATDLEKLTQWEREREEDFKALDATRAAFRGVPDEELDLEVARAIEEVRARNRDFATIDELREAFKDVPDEELEREVAKAIAEARRQYKIELQRRPKAS